MVSFGQDKGLNQSDHGTIAAKYLCSFCGLLLKDPVQTTCGHCYCRSCIVNLDIRNDKSQMQCRVCGNFLSQDEVFSDNFMKREVLALKVHCPSKEEGCNWKGEVKELEVREHQDPVKGDCEAIAGPCAFVQAGCTHTEAMNADDRNKHLTSGTERHLSLLMAFMIKISEDVQSLLRSGAGAASGTVASAMGATASAAATFLSDSESTVRSLLSRVEGVTKESKDLRQRLREQSDRITSVERITASLPNTSSEGASTYRSLNANTANTSQAELVRRLVNIEHTVADHVVLLGENGRNVEDARHQNSYLQRQLELAQETIRRLERRVESQDHLMALRNVALADLEEYIRQQEVSSYNGVLLWKITDFTRRRNDARAGKQTSFYSPSFYTSRHGYKMCARIYLNGDGCGKGTHISLFFVVMRGQFDALLRWPFRQKVTLMILDQDNVEHVIDAFRPDPNSSSFQRPQREMNIASGCPQFCPNSDLDKHAYVRDDTMFVKIIVDTMDL